MIEPGYLGLSECVNLHQIIAVEPEIEKRHMFDPTWPKYSTPYTLDNMPIPPPPPLHAVL